MATRMLGRSNVTAAELAQRERIVDIMEATPGKEWSIDDIAKELGVHRVAATHSLCHIARFGVISVTRREPIAGTRYVQRWYIMTDEAKSEHEPDGPRDALTEMWYPRAFIIDGLPRRVHIMENRRR